MYRYKPRACMRRHILAKAVRPQALIVIKNAAHTLEGTRLDVVLSPLSPHLSPGDPTSRHACATDPNAVGTRTPMTHTHTKLDTLDSGAVRKHEDLIALSGAAMSGLAPALEHTHTHNGAYLVTRWLLPARDGWG